MKNKLIVVYYYRDGQIDWELHLKLYMSNWEAHSTAYIYKKEIKNTTPRQALKSAILQWQKVTNISSFNNCHNFSIMIRKTKDMYVSLKTIGGKEIEEYMK